MMEKPVELYDMHCHLDLMPSMVTFADYAQKMGIGILAVTTTPKAYAKENEVLERFLNVHVALGLHPQLVSERYNELEMVEKFISECDFIGEVGLDYKKQYYLSKDKQLEVFENIINWSSQLKGKVISIHSVYADKQVLDVLEKYVCTENNACILHWFSGTLPQLQRAIEMGCFFSVNNAMFKSANGQKLIRCLPHTNILLESDAPFVDDINIGKIHKDYLDNLYVSVQKHFGHDVLADIAQTSANIMSLKQKRPDLSKVIFANSHGKFSEQGTI
jgi:TatD DNase family protein